MTVEEMFNDKNFKKILDEENSEAMVDYLYHNLPRNKYVLIANMFKDLGIFQDIAMHNADPKKKYKYIIDEAFNDKTRGTVDVRGATICYDGIYNPVDCEIILDNTTNIQRKGLRIAAWDGSSKYVLTFLGIPNFEEYGGIEISVSTLDQVEIRAKANIINKVKELFEEWFIKSNKATLKDRIKEI